MAAGITSATSRCMRGKSGSAGQRSRMPTLRRSSETASVARSWRKTVTGAHSAGRCVHQPVMAWRAGYSPVAIEATATGVVEG